MDINIDEDLTAVTKQIDDLVKQLNEITAQRDQLMQQVQNLNGIAMYLRGKQPPEVEESVEEAPSVINAEDIASVVSKWTGIPLEKLIGGEKDKLINIEKLLEKRVIGQQDAIEKVSKAIKSSKAGLQDPDNRGSYL